MSRLRALWLCVLLGALFQLPPLDAQVSAIAPRVAGPTDESSLVTLHGSLSVVVQPQYDRGEAPPATQLQYVRLVLQRSPQQEAALERFMAEQIDPNSPNYHHWLNQDEFNRLYGMADSDVAAVVAWLQSHGLKVETISSTNVAFSGTVPQVEEALHTSIHSFVTASGRQFLSNTSEPRIPKALAPVIGGVAFLNTLRPRAHLDRGPSGAYDPQEQSFIPAISAGLKSQPDLTTGSGSGQFLWVVPADAATIYDTPNSYNANFASGSSYDGTGVTIGIGGDALIQTATVGSFRSRFLNGDTNVPTIINVNGSATTSPAGNLDEAYLDSEVAGALAPGAAIRFYTASDADGGVGTAIDTMLNESPTKVDVFSLSFGECELFLTTSDNSMISQWWQNAAAKGIAVTVSTGDSGSAGCDDQNKVNVASLGLNVSGFATTPYNIAVGGTDFYALANSFSNYVNTNQSSTNSYRSALQYVPESPWNDSSSQFPPGPLSTNVALVNQSQTSIVAASGGVSNCSTNSSTATITGTCTSGYAKPAWQRGTNVPGDGARDVPDVSLLAGNGLYGATWLVCTDDTDQSSGFPQNCKTQSNNEFYFAGIGGTSASAPAFAGILALLTQKAGGPVGMSGAKLLYDIYNQTGSNAFHDVTLGNISVPCTQSTPGCKQNAASNYFMTGYDAGTGYDLATGLGSVDATNFITAYGSTSTAVFGVTASTPAAIAAGASATSTITVSTSSGYAGTVSFTCSLTSSPTGAQDLPACSAGANVTLSSTATSATTTVSVSTTASTATLDRRGVPGWLGAGGGTALALLVFFGIPARRRSWRNLLGLLVLITALGSLSACGGGGGSNGGGGGNPGTTAGTYTFQVTGTGSPAGGGPYNATFTVTVN